ncbi:MAG: PQQ-dependent sugar dehydrogenase, partial [Sandaracinaceae bacterium]|nr:PQQ-dependent sugar dehydrogenase [Sandaracinaceae bacterium]
GTGDGGNGCDEHGSGNFNAQNLMSPLGKIHRFDVDAAAPYVAAGNPFSGAGQVRTIWSYGWRNPWRFSFDRMTGDLWVGDVGQGRREEVDFQPAASTGGENYGWHFREGTISSAMSGCAGGPEPAGHVPPIFDYPRGGGGTITGNTVIGGFVYRGSAIAGLQGWYLFGDAGSGGRAAIRQCPGGAINVRTLTDLVGLAPALTSFGQDNNGELYMLALFDGEVLRIVAR